MALYLFVFLFCVMTAAVLNSTLIPGIRTLLMNRRLAARGIEADAVLLSIERTGHFMNQQPEVKLQVQVRSLSGRNVVFEIREVVPLPDLRRLQVGGLLKVRYNPRNCKEAMMVRWPPR